MIVVKVGPVAAVEAVEHVVVASVVVPVAAETSPVVVAGEVVAERNFFVAEVGAIIVTSKQTG